MDNRIFIGDRVRHIDMPAWTGRIKGVQLSVPGVEHNYYIQWDFCDYVSGPISGHLVEREPDAAATTSGKVGNVA